MWVPVTYWEPQAVLAPLYAGKRWGFIFVKQHDWKVESHLRKVIMYEKLHVNSGGCIFMKEPDWKVEYHTPPVAMVLLL